MKLVCNDINASTIGNPTYEDNIDDPFLLEKYAPQKTQRLLFQQIPHAIQVRSEKPKENVEELKENDRKQTLQYIKKFINQLLIMLLK